MYSTDSCASDDMYEDDMTSYPDEKILLRHINELGNSCRICKEPFVIIWFDDWYLKDAICQHKQLYHLNCFKENSIKKDEFAGEFVVALGTSQSAFCCRICSKSLRDGAFILTCCGQSICVKCGDNTMQPETDVQCVLCGSTNLTVCRNKLVDELVMMNFMPSQDLVFQFSALDVFETFVNKIRDVSSFVFDFFQSLRNKIDLRIAQLENIDMGTINLYETMCKEYFEETSIVANSSLGVDIDKQITFISNMRKQLQTIAVWRRDCSTVVSQIRDQIYDFTHEIYKLLWKYSIVALFDDYQFITVRFAATLVTSQPLAEHFDRHDSYGRCITTPSVILSMYVCKTGRELIYLRHDDKLNCIVLCKRCLQTQKHVEIEVFNEDGVYQELKCLFFQSNEIIVLAAEKIIKKNRRRNKIITEPGFLIGRANELGPFKFVSRKIHSIFDGGLGGWLFMWHDVNYFNPKTNIIRIEKTRTPDRYQVDIFKQANSAVFDGRYGHTVTNGDFFVSLVHKSGNYRCAIATWRLTADMTIVNLRTFIINDDNTSEVFRTHSLCSNYDYFYGMQMMQYFKMHTETNLFHSSVCGLCLFSFFFYLSLTFITCMFVTF